jgi:hypothetical protein
MYVYIYVYIYIYTPDNIPVISPSCGYHQHLQPGADQLLAAKVRVAWYVLFRGMGWLSMCLDSTEHPFGGVLKWLGTPSYHRFKYFKLGFSMK